MVLIRRALEADFIFTPDEYTGELRVLKFTGAESISEPFRYRLKLASRDAMIDFDTIIGKPALLTIYGEIGERYVNGIVTKFIQDGVGNRYTYYHTELMPLVWLMTMRNDCRIFQNKSVQEIILDVFEAANIPSDNYRFALQGSHTPHEYCVQYRESDFNFISRLMEEEGISYFFEHTEDNHVMVIADNSSTYSPIDSATIIFREASGLVQEQEYIHNFRFAQQVRPGKVELREFNYERPTLDMTNTNGDGDLEIYDYPGDYLDPGVGSDLVQLRLESLQAKQKTGSGQSVCRRFIPGYRFTMDSHPRSSFNLEYLITRLASSGSQPLGEGSSDDETPNYSNEFECIPFSVPYRPLLKTPKGRIDGLQTAMVVGPSGDDIYFDQFGRVKVQFHWDRKGQKDENSSCWVRVSDGYAGQKHGIQFTPLIGDEVIVSFLEGDPDRPIITGRVYNGDNRPHLDPQNRIQNQILTPYQHRLLFDDKNAEIILKTGGNERITMQDGSKDSEMGNHIHIDTADSHKIHLNGGQHPQIGIQTQAKNQMIFDDEFKKISIWTTNGHRAEFDDDAAKITIQSAKGNRIIIDDNNNSITAIDSHDQHKIQIAADGQKITISTDTGSIDILAPSGTITMKAGSINMSAGSITETASGDITLKATNINASTDADFNVDASGQVNLKSGGPTNIESGPTMDIKAGGVLTIQGTLVKIN